MRRKVNPNIKLFEKKVKTKTLPKLKREAWAWFSQYIRLRDCLKTTRTLHYGKCYTCSREIAFKGSQAGHFLPGRKNAVLFEEDQVHLQCMPCNVWEHGSWPEYYEHMVKDWGLDRVQQMMYERHAVKKLTRADLENIIARYKQKVTDLISQ